MKVSVCKPNRDGQQGVFLVALPGQLFLHHLKLLHGASFGPDSSPQVQALFAREIRGLLRRVTSVGSFASAADAAAVEAAAAAFSGDAAAAAAAVAAALTTSAWTS